MTFKKLALAAAIATVPMASFAVESLDDATLSAATGQDGLAINLDLAVTTNTLIHDKDGIDAAYQASYGSAGAIVISNMAINATGVIVEIDAGDDSSTTSLTAPVLNVNVNLSNGLTLETGTIGVGNSNRDDGAWGAVGTVNIMNNMTISVGATSLNIQLGNEPQGAMIRINAAISGGLTMNNMGITDASVGGGTLGSASMTLIDTGGGPDLSVDADINITATGLQIDVNQLGTLVGGMDVQIVDQYLGNPALIVGDVEMQGLNLAGTVITISGK